MKFPASFALLLFSLGVSQAQAPPDLILLNGKILTVDGQFSTAEAIAITGDRIVAVGTSTELSEIATPQTRTIDLLGKTVTPGFVDGHIHASTQGHWRKRVHIGFAATKAEALEMIRARAAALRAGEWILAPGAWAVDQYPDSEGGFTREELDAAAPENPVALVEFYERSFLNSAALRAVGIDESTPNPPFGKIVKDADGQPTGEILGFQAARMFYGPALPELARDDLREELLAVRADLNRVGVTAIGDQSGPTRPGSDRTAFELVQQLAAEGDLTVRQYQYLSGYGTGFFLNRELAGDVADTVAIIQAFTPFTGHPANDFYEIVGFGEHLYSPVFDLPGVQRLPTHEEAEEYRALLMAAAESGIQIHEHIIWGNLLEFVLDMFEEVNEVHPIRALRWTLAHAEGLTPDMMERARRLGVMISVASRHVYQGAWERKRISEALEGALDAGQVEEMALLRPRLADIDNSGAIWAVHTDGMNVNSYSPFDSIWWLTTGKMHGAGVVTAQTVSRESALIATTRSSAYLMFQEHDIGSLEPGKLADLVVLDRDYMTIPLDEIKDIKPVATMVGGSIVHGRL